MTPSETMFLPRSMSGSIVRLTKTSDGGAESVAWDGVTRTWVPVDVAVGDVMASPVATDAKLIERGIPTGRLKVVR